VAPWEDWLTSCSHMSRRITRFMSAFLSERLPRVKAFPLEGTYLAWLDMRRLGLTDEELKKKLLCGAGVWLDEGTDVRARRGRLPALNLACPRTILTDALQRMAGALGERR